MVDRADLGRINALYGENNDITRALANFDAGGSITAMTIGGTVPQEPPPEGSEEDGETEVIDLSDVTIDTTSWVYPAMMVEAIKQNLRNRQEEIKHLLAELGITGLPDMPETLPEPTGGYVFPPRA